MELMPSFGRAGLFVHCYFRLSQVTHGMEHVQSVPRSLRLQLSAFPNFPWSVKFLFSLCMLPVFLCMATPLPTTRATAVPSPATTVQSPALLPISISASMVRVLAKQSCQWQSSSADRHLHWSFCLLYAAKQLRENVH